MTENKLPII